MGNDIYRNSGTTNLPTWIATDFREKDSTETGPLLLNYCMTGRCKIILNNGNFAYVKDGEWLQAHGFRRPKPDGRNRRRGGWARPAAGNRPPLTGDRRLGRTPRLRRIWPRADGTDCRRGAAKTRGPDVPGLNRSDAGAWYGQRRDAEPRMAGVKRNKRQAMDNRAGRKPEAANRL